MFTIIVCLKITLDTSQLRPHGDRGAPKLDGAPLRVSLLDENALELAVQLKEEHGARIVAVSLVSGSAPRDLVLKALAIGADEVVLIRDDTAFEADALATTAILAAAVRKLEPWSLLICGDGSSDQYNRQVGPRLADSLGLPSLTLVTKVQLAGEQITVDRALEEYVEVVEAKLPVLITVSPEINHPRLPTVLQIMGASRKPVTEWDLQDLGFPAATSAAGLAGLNTLKVTAPPSERKRVAIEGESAEEIGRKLARIFVQEGLVKTT
ncbi:MAG: electron transfer flavoprotein subunit beta/FixA family protein [Acidobacteriota bacterium]